MIKLKVCLSFLSILITLNLKGQSTLIYETKLDKNNHKIKLIDSKLISVIDSFISIIKKQDVYFKRKGYVTVKITNKMNENIPISYNPENCLYINFSYTRYFGSEDFKIFPKYYTYINNKLILFFEGNNSSELSKRQIKSTTNKFIRLTNKYIKKPKFVTVLDSNENKIKLQNIGNHGFGAGFYFCFSKTNSQNPFIYKPQIY